MADLEVVYAVVHSADDDSHRHERVFLIRVSALLGFPIVIVEKATKIGRLVNSLSDRILKHGLRQANPSDMVWWLPGRT